MAYATQDSHGFAPHSTVLGFFGRIAQSLVEMAEQNPRLKKVRVLQAMSDDELAERGIKREDIVRIVFGDTFYI